MPVAFEIQKEIPLPPQFKRQNKYPWNEMEIGDSFLAPHNGGLSASCRMQSRNGKEFISRIECRGTRVWRVK